jgi:hypothetical protein
MSLESLLLKIEKDGYYTFIRNDELFIGKFIEKDNATGIITYHLYCYILIQDDQYVVDYSREALPEIEKFSSESEVYAYIRKTFVV